MGLKRAGLKEIESGEEITVNYIIVEARFLDKVQLK